MVFKFLKKIFASDDKSDADKNGTANVASSSRQEDPQVSGRKVATFEALSGNNVNHVDADTSLMQNKWIHLLDCFVNCKSEHQFLFLNY